MIYKYMLNIAPVIKLIIYPSLDIKFCAFYFFGGGLRFRLLIILVLLVM